MGAESSKEMEKLGNYRKGGLNVSYQTFAI